ncbi:MULTISPECIES: DnaJ domain-containing protein [Rhodomicrobium]|uniref:DnaJ domain-containing protein n=1 Tax=Rhodomicrobium vannielii TaxID=1069 RepID=UPI002477F4A1|nr:MULTISPECIES: DnaJ domain-containing protein [Rhodomicrobium]
MADPVHLDKLCQGPKVWNAWRRDKTELLPDLRDASLTLSQRQFGPSNGGPVNLSDADLSGAALRYATLTGADFQHATLIAADLVHSRLDGANLTAADLTDSLFDHADLAGAQLDGAIVIGASFANVRNLTQAQIAVAHGDASTVLPPHLTPPDSWFPQLEDDFFREYAVPERARYEDLYEVLGVVRTAKPDEIRASFRNLVKKFHPDLNPGDVEAQESFKRVSTAYRILNDAEKRVRYDRGEIGHDGEISPEFAARKQFRRYAFRFYAAAAMSLLLCGSVLGVVWHSVLSEDRGRVAIAVATPPKTLERLESTPWSDAGARMSNGTPVRTNTEAAPQQTKLFGAEARLETHRPQRDAVASGAHPAAAAEPPGALARTDAPQADAGTEAPAGQGEQAAPNTETASDASAAPEQQTASAEPAPGTAGDSAAPAPAAGTPPAADHAEPAPAPEQKLASLTEAPDAAPTPSETASGQDPAPAQAESPAGEQPPAPPGPEQRAAAAEVEPQPAASDLGGTARPLGDDHSEKAARPAQADAAGSVAPAQIPAQPASPGAAQIQAEDLGRDALGRVLMRGVQGGRSSRDAVSDMFRIRAVRNALGEDRSQSTASMDPLAPRDRDEDQEEVWDLYTHSLPDEQAGEERPWPASLKTEPSQPRPSLSAKVPHVTGKVPEKAPAQPRLAQEQRQPEPDRRLRRQAISDILAGGL